MNTTIDAIERLLKNRQAIPSGLIRDLVIECKAQKALNHALKQRVEELERDAREKAEAAK